MQAPECVSRAKRQGCRPEQRVDGDKDVDGITGTTLLVVKSQLFLKNPQVNDLTAAGFTEIKVKRGKWGIFPYREQNRWDRNFKSWLPIIRSEVSTRIASSACFKGITPIFITSI